MKLNKGKLILSTLMILIIIFALHVSIDFIRYPEKYSTTWKRQLEMDLLKGDEKAEKYYYETYISNECYLFDSKYINFTEGE